MLCFCLSHHLPEYFASTLGIVPSETRQVWGRSTKHDPMRCGLAHPLQDEDVLQIVPKTITQQVGNSRGDTWVSSGVRPRWTPFLSIKCTCPEFHSTSVMSEVEVLLHIHNVISVWETMISYNISSCSRVGGDSEPGQDSIQRGVGRELPFVPFSF